MTDTRRWLKEEELEVYNQWLNMMSHVKGKHVQEVELQIAIFDDLAECRRLLKKREWAESPNYRYAFICLECKSETGQLGSDLGMAKKNFPNEFIHEPDCALARQTEGLPNEEVK